jgi:hypothetical protein
MKLSELAHTKNLHHAYIVIGEKGAPEVISMLETRGVKTAGNPDVLALSFIELSVDNAREISSYASLKPLSDAKYFVITFSRATGGAQNALLKVVEEAPGNSIFFFCVEASGHMLPTLRSRAIEISTHKKSAEESEGSTEAVEFLRGTFEERLKKVDSIASYISKTQNRGPVRAFVKELLTLIHAQGASPEALRDLLDAERYMRQQGSSVKTVLGHLAVSLPRHRS